MNKHEHELCINLVQIQTLTATNLDSFILVLAPPFRKLGIINFIVEHKYSSQYTQNHKSGEYKKKVLPGCQSKSDTQSTRANQQ